MKRLYILLAFAYIVIAHCIVNNMDYKLAQQEEAWSNSVQALELEQEKIQLEIEETREKLLKAEEQIRAHNLLFGTYEVGCI